MTADAVGGVWTYALDLAAGLAAQGVGTSLAVIGPAPDAAQAAAAARVPGLALHHLPAGLDWLARDRAEVAATAQALAALAAEAELVHLNTPAFAALARFPAPVVAVSHSCLTTWWSTMRGGTPPADIAWRGALHGAGLAAAGLVVAPSAAFARATAVAHDLPVLPRVVHNGRAPAQRPASGPIGCAFTAGRLWDAGKGAATLDRAAARLGLPVLAAGATTGPDGSRIALPHLRCLGPLPAPRLAAWLARRPVFVSMARYEPFGLGVLEAAQAGCALVLADTPVFRELWDGAADFVPAGDDAALAALLRALVPDHARRAALGHAAAAQAGRYGLGAMTRAMLDAYGGLLRSQGRGLAA
jgi:glycosyltransferase involved in cell wall biosynthesis